MKGLCRKFYFEVKDFANGFPLGATMLLMRNKVTPLVKTSTKENFKRL